MSVDEAPPADPPVPGERVMLPLIVAEARRQLNICNACRYCEGLCAVFPALERRSVLEQGDISQIANLCHDCRACFDGCMYTSPHEFAVNLPNVLSNVRVVDYKRYVWPRRVPRIFSGWTGVFSGAVLAVLVVFLVAIVHSGWHGLVRATDSAQGPYELIPYGLLLVLLFLPAVFSLVVMIDAGRAYWREVAGGNDRLSGRALGRAVWYAATLRYLRGGGAECYYPDDETPTPTRRNLHALVAYGFGLCIVSTVSAAVLQDIIGSDPPYSYLSVPVIAGTVGGVGLTVGSVGLLLLKARSSQVTSFAEMTIKDYGLLVGLSFLALSGLATLLTRETAAFGVVFLVHLAAIELTFAVAPYSKLVHLVFRFLAIVRDEIERESAARGTAYLVKE